MLIDTSIDKFKKSPSLKHWGDIQNLKTAAANYAEAGNLTELKEKIERKSGEGSVIRSELISIGKELKDLKEIWYYLQQYKDNAPFKQQYNNSRDKQKYKNITEYLGLDKSGVFAEQSRKVHSR